LHRLQRFPKIRSIAKRNETEKKVAADRIVSFDEHRNDNRRAVVQRLSLDQCFLLAQSDDAWR